MHFLDAYTHRSGCDSRQRRIVLQHTVAISASACMRNSARDDRVMAAFTAFSRAPANPSHGASVGAQKQPGKPTTERPRNPPCIH